MKCLESFSTDNRLYFRRDLSYNDSYSIISYLCSGAGQKPLSCLKNHGRDFWNDENYIGCTRNSLQYLVCLFGVFSWSRLNDGGKKVTTRKRYKHEKSSNFVQHDSKTRFTLFKGKIEQEVYFFSFWVDFIFSSKESYYISEIWNHH